MKPILILSLFILSCMTHITHAASPEKRISSYSFCPGEKQPTYQANTDYISEWNTSTGRVAQIGKIKDTIPYGDNYSLPILSIINDSYLQVQHTSSGDIALIDGRVVGQYERVITCTLTPQWNQEVSNFVSDGQHTAFVIQEGGKSYAVIDGKRDTKSYPNIGFGKTFLDSGDYYYFSYKKGEYGQIEASNIIMNGEKIPYKIGDKITGDMASGYRLSNTKKEHFLFLRGDIIGPFAPGWEALAFYGVGADVKIILINRTTYAKALWEDGKMGKIYQGIQPISYTGGVLSYLGIISTEKTEYESWIRGKTELVKDGTVIESWDRLYEVEKRWGMGHRDEISFWGQSSFGGDEDDLMVSYIGEKSGKKALFEKETLKRKSEWHDDIGMILMQYTPDTFSDTGSTSTGYIDTLHYTIDGGVLSTYFNNVLQGTYLCHNKKDIIDGNTGVKTYFLLECDEGSYMIAPNGEVIGTEYARILSGDIYGKIKVKNSKGEVSLIQLTGKRGEKLTKKILIPWSKDIGDYKVARLDGNFDIYIDGEKIFEQSFQSVDGGSSYIWSYIWLFNVHMQDGSVGLCTYSIMGENIGGQCISGLQSIKRTGVYQKAPKKIITIAEIERGGKVEIIDVSTNQVLNIKLTEKNFTPFMTIEEVFAYHE